MIPPPDMPAPTDPTRAWVDVDLGALVANARTVAAVSGSRLLPMVKANGYGLGAVDIARALEPLDPWGYGVATPEEGAALRASGVSRPILVATPLLSDAIDAYLTHDLRPSIGDPNALATWCARTDRPFHLEIDTGMGRAGVPWNDTSALAAIRSGLSRAAGWEGVYTHFHSADTDEASLATQWDRFQDVVRALPRRPALVHAANSAAALRGRCYAADLVRPGIYLYGGEAWGTSPRPVARLQARVVAVRSVEPGETVSYGATWRAQNRTTIATLGIGYADGFLRASDDSERRERVVELGGRSVPIVGRVTMDMCMVEVRDSQVAVGDVATIYGGLVSLDRQARAAGTISYELLTALGARLLRRYRYPE
jgi:alanine racemase